MSHFIYNSKMYAAGSPILGPDNRGLRYGDGVFETMKFFDNRIILMDEHFARLWKGMQLFQFQIPKLFTPDLLQQQIMDLLKKNNHNSARIRIAVFRGDGGMYDANNIPQYLIQTWALPAGSGKWNENGLHAGIYSDARKTADSFANCKHNNYLPYFMGALHAKKHKWNDAIILNQYNRICDSTMANIFVIKNEKIITPPLSEGCVAGVIRKLILQTLPSYGFHIGEEVITPEMLLEADEVFFTNSIINIRWLSAIDNSSYSKKITQEVYTQMVNSCPETFST